MLMTGKRDSLSQEARQHMTLAEARDDHHQDYQGAGHRHTHLSAHLYIRIRRKYRA